MVTLFLENFKEETSFLIWDFLFLEGNIVLIKTCLIIFCILKRKLLENENNFEDLFVILTSETNTIKRNNPTLLHGLSVKQFEFTEEYLEMTREMLSESIVKGIDEDNKEKFNKKREMDKRTQRITDNEIESNPIKCNVKWPICFEEENIDKPITVNKYLILQQSNQGEIDYDYFFNTLSGKKGKNVNKEEEPYDILIERQKHSCYSSKVEELRNKLTYHMHNIIKYTTSKDNSTINDKAFIYRKMSTKIDYVAAREQIKKFFKAKPYKEEFFSEAKTILNN